MLYPFTSTIRRVQLFAAIPILLLAMPVSAALPDQAAPKRQDVRVDKGVPTLKTSRIVGPGARDAKAGEVPWQVALIIADLQDPDSHSLCGGSNIGNGWVLTAAHCVQGYQNLPAKVEVFSGMLKLSDPQAKRSKAAKVIVHPLYCDGTNDYDVALVKADVAGTAIKLADATPAPASRLVVSGFGTTSEGGETSDALQLVEVEVKTESACNATASYNGRVSDKMLCAGSLKPKPGEEEKPADSCQGDSGGPLFVAGANPRLAGVVSWGEGCARQHKYGVYADVADLAVWIKANAK